MEDENLNIQRDIDENITDVFQILMKKINTATKNKADTFQPRISNITELINQDQISLQKKSDRLSKIYLCYADVVSYVHVLSHFLEIRSKSVESLREVTEERISVLADYSQEHSTIIKQNRELENEISEIKITITELEKEKQNLLDVLDNLNQRNEALKRRNDKKEGKLKQIIHENLILNERKEIESKMIEAGIGNKKRRLEKYQKMLGMLEEEINVKKTEREFSNQKKKSKLFPQETPHLFPQETSPTIIRKFSSRFLPN